MTRISSPGRILLNSFRVENFLPTLAAGASPSSFLREREKLARAGIPLLPAFVSVENSSQLRALRKRRLPARTQILFNSGARPAEVSQLFPLLRGEERDSPLVVEEFPPRNPKFFPGARVRIWLFRRVPVMAAALFPEEKVLAAAALTRGKIAAAARRESLSWRQVESLQNGSPLLGREIPLWPETLTLAAEVAAQLDSSEMLALDFFLGEEEPILCGIPAAGEFLFPAQLIGKTPLRERRAILQKLPAPEPARAVSLTRELFAEGGEEKPAPLSGGKGVVGTLEIAKIFRAEGKRFHRLPIAIDPAKEKSFLALELAEILGLLSADDEAGKKKLVSLELAGQRFVAEFLLRAGRKKPHLLLGRDALGDFLVDPSREDPAAQELLRAEEARQPAILPGLRKVDTQLAEIDARLALDFSPENFFEERQKFLAGDRRESPQFIYQENGEDFDALRRQLDALEIDASPFGELLEEKRRELLLRADLCAAAGKDPAVFPLAAARLFPRPTTTEIAAARKDLAAAREAPRRRGEKKVSAKEAAALFQKELKKRGLVGWEVFLIKGAERIAADFHQRKIFLRQGGSFPRELVVAALAAEVGIRATLAENARRQPFRLPFAGTAGAEETEEGLAAFYQEAIAPDPQRRLLRAAAVLAAARAAEDSFAGVFYFLKEEGLEDSAAFSLAFQVKKGLAATEVSGAFCRAALPFRGFQKIRRALEKGEDLRQLLLGRVALADLPFLEKISALCSPALVPPSWEKVFANPKKRRQLSSSPA